MTDRGGIYNSQWRAGCGTERPESGGMTAKGLLQSFDLVGFEPCLPQMTSAIEATSLDARGRGREAIPAPTPAPHVTRSASAGQRTRGTSASRCALAAMRSASFASAVARDVVRVCCSQRRLWAR